uniref:Pentatricopeptide repeat-containing protein n=1 Tax=Salix viminalis TaxID=40686 RepID=A0A6N2MLU7_SALVM
MAVQVFKKMEQNGGKPNVIVQRNGRKDDMPDTVTFNILVDGSARSNVSEARCVFDIMPEKGVEPDVITYNALTNGLCNEGKLKMH